MSDNELRDAGLKVTSPRLKVLELLQNAETRHVSAEDVYKQLQASGENVALATIYRVLTQFEAAGIVTRHNFSEGYSVFELDAGEHHDHMVCEKCGKVVEFVDPEIEKLQIEIAEKNQFKITDHNLTIYGVCKACLD